MANLELSMLRRASASKLVPIVVILVGMLFFFHGSQGSFQTTNGPTTTLKECAIGLLLQALVILVASALIAISTCATTSFADHRVLLRQNPLACPSPAPLRC